MRASILARIFHRVQVNKSERLVLDVILSKANMFGKHARVAHEVIQAITGLARSTVYAAIARLESLFEKYQAASRLSIKRVIATYTNVSLVLGNSS